MKRSKIWEQKGTSPDPLSLMGQIVFSPDRVDDVSKTEPNTSFEKKLKKILDSHIYDDEVNDEEVEHVIAALENGEYPDYIHEPRVQQVFRGLRIDERSLPYLKKWLGLGKNDNIPKSGEVDGSWNISSIRSSTSSFSIDFNVALDYSGWNKPILNKTSYGVILVANVLDNKNKFFDLSDLYPTIDSYSGFAFENEAIGLGPIKISKIMFKHREIKL